jgi:hypothetical protein
MSQLCLIDSNGSVVPPKAWLNICRRGTALTRKDEGGLFIFNELHLCDSVAVALLKGEETQRQTTN